MRVHGHYQPLFIRENQAQVREKLVQLQLKILVECFLLFMPYQVLVASHSPSQEPLLVLSPSGGPALVLSPGPGPSISQENEKSKKNIILISSIVGVLLLMMVVFYFMRRRKRVGVAWGKYRRR